jgi:3-hydroxy acid dehydrogenase/malonic semialdehyde reductase
MSTILITGASSGIGEATAKLFANKGFDLVLVARRLERLEKIKSEITNVNVDIITADVRSQESIELIEKLLKNKSINILFNNAGLAKGIEPMPQGKWSDWEEMIDTNVKGLLRITKVCLPSIVSNQGFIVNVGSVAGRWVYPGGGVYCATKFAVRALTEGLRLDLKGTGVRVCNIEPGMVETEFSVVRLGNQEKADKVYERMTPLSAYDIAEQVY